MTISGEKVWCLAIFQIISEITSVSAFLCLAVYLFHVVSRILCTSLVTNCSDSYLIELVLCKEFIYLF